MKQVFLGGKTSTFTRADSELHPRGSLNHLYGAFLPGFLWLVILH